MQRLSDALDPRVLTEAARPQSAPISSRVISGFNPEQLVFSEDRRAGRVSAHLAFAACGACFSGLEYYHDARGYRFTKPCGVCGPARRVIRRFERLGLPPEWARVSEETTEWRGAHRVLYDGFLARWEPYGPGLFLYGPTGTGKTHLAALLAYALAFRDVKVEWYRWGLFLEQLREGYDSQSINRTKESALRRRVLDADVLIVDDLGEGRKTAWTAEIFERVVGQRLERGLTTIITSNITLDELSEFVERRAYSRMMKACIPICVDGEDRRLRV